MAVGRGNGKVLLFGEHAAVYGHPAVGTTIDLSTSVAFAPEPGGIDLTGVSDNNAAQVLELIGIIGKALGVAPNRLNGSYQVASDIPVGSGLGSSAALSAAVTRAIADERCPDADETAIWFAANEGEKFFHGTPSGIDTGLATSKGIFAFASEGATLPTRTALSGVELSILVATSPRSGSTASLVGALRKQIENKEPTTTQAMATLGALAEDVIQHMQSSPGSLEPNLGTAADTAHATLTGLGLSTPDVDHFLVAGKQEGALGGKISGAGGGGACFLVFQDSFSASAAWPKIEDKLAKKHSSVTLLTVHSLQS